MSDGHENGGAFNSEQNDGPMPVKCARTVCNNEGKFRHRDLDGLYCWECGWKINHVCGVRLVDIPQLPTGDSAR